MGTLEREFSIERWKRFKKRNNSVKEKDHSKLDQILNDTRFWVSLTTCVGILGFGLSLHFLIHDFPTRSLLTQIFSFAIISLLTISWGWLAVATSITSFLEKISEK